MVRNKLLSIADGKIFSGRQALNLNLIDTIGSYYDAVNYIKVKNNFEDIEVIERIEEKRSFFDFIFNVLSNKLEASKTKHILPQYLIVN